MNPEPFFAVLERIEAYAADLAAIGPDLPPAPRWNQDWFPRLDAAAAYALVRSEPPRRVVEVGSGHSTRFLARAVADGGLATRITAIDPEPRASIAGLDVAFLRKPVQETQVELEAGAAKDASVRVDPRLLAVYRPARRGWQVAAGEYRVTLASSAGDPGQSVTVQLPERWLAVGAGQGGAPE